MSPERIWLVSMTDEDEHYGMDRGDGTTLDAVAIWPCDSEESARNTAFRLLATKIGQPQADAVLAANWMKAGGGPYLVLDAFENGRMVQVHYMPMVRASRTGWILVEAANRDLAFFNALALEEVY